MVAAAAAAAAGTPKKGSLAPRANGGGGGGGSLSKVATLVVPQFVPLLLVSVRGGVARGGLAPARLSVVVRPPLPLEGASARTAADAGLSNAPPWDFNFESVFVPRATRRADGSAWDTLSLTDGRRMFDGGMEGHGAKVEQAIALQKR
jgi:hypothetical protein